MRWPSAKTRRALAIAVGMTLFSALAWSTWGAAVLAALAERGVELDSPGFLALLGLLPVLLVLASFSLTEHGPIQRAPSGLLRGALIVSIVAALLGPSELSEEPSMTSTVFVVDVSDSISDGALERARSTIEETWRRRGRHEVRVVTYGAHAAEVSPPKGPDEPWPALARLDEDGGQASDTEGALALALSLLPADRLGRVVLATDGRDTRGDVLSMAHNAARFGIRVHHLSLEPGREASELVVVDLVVPENPTMRVPFSVEAKIHATRAMTARCEVLIDAIVDQERTLELDAETQSVAFEMTIKEGGDHDVAVSCEAMKDGSDRFGSNNRVSRAIHLPERPRILYVEGESRYTRNLIRALEADFDVELRSGRGLPRSDRDARTFDAILISDVARLGSMGVEQMAPSQMRVLERYARAGGGLIFTGGENSLGPGGYGGTHLERAVLPVTLDVDKEDEIPSLAMVLVLDRSGSMNGEKLSLAKEAARVTLDVLQPSDKLGIVAFDSAPRVLAPLQRASNRMRISDALSRLSPGGGTAIFPALDQAVGLLTETEAKIKHIILLTDGQSNRSGILDLVALASSERITISTVGVGSGSDQKLLMEIAEEGAGRYYFTDRADNIPRLFLKEASEVSRRSLVEERFRAGISKRHRDAQVFRGLNWKRAPALLGYVSTRAKSRAEVLMRTPRGEPLLARWRLGLGQVWVWTSDVKNKWAHYWLRWPGYAQFWRQLLRDALRVERTDPTLAMKTEIDQGVLEVAVDAIDADDRFIDDLRSTVRVEGPEGTVEELQLDQVAPGHYLGRATLTTLGAYRIRGEHHAHEAPDQSMTSSANVTWPYPDEHAVGTSDLRKLEALAAITGGRIDPSPSQLFDTEGRTHPVRLDRRARWLWLALVLLILDVLARRLNVGAQRPPRGRTEARA